jgi:hypothetical protein
MAVTLIKCPKCGSTQCHPLFIPGLDAVQCIPCGHEFDMYGRWLWTFVFWLRRKIHGRGFAS